jgi:p-cumate 2,3-dioxygenase beta subunit
LRGNDDRRPAGPRAAAPPRAAVFATPVTDVLVLDRSGDTLQVEAASRSGAFATRADYHVGCYDHTLVVTNDGLRIRSKRATMDMTSLHPAGAVSIIL